MIALEDYESLQETAYLLRNTANAKRLVQSIEAAEKGITIEREIDLNEWTFHLLHKHGKTMNTSKRPTKDS